MTARSRHNNEWDLMKEEFNNSTYDPQYPDDDIGGGVQLDHCRLYIRNIPKGLSEEGLRTAFARYGTLTEVHVSKDPMKRYALVRYETPGEAKSAMTKLNNTDPLKLIITVAHKTKAVKKDNQSRENRDRSYSNGPNRNSNREDVSSVSSKGKHSRRQEDILNGDDMEELMPTFDDDLDTETKLKGLQLELQRLQVHEQTVLLRQQLLQLEAARKKNLSQSTTSNRCILPDGRIVVRNTNERSLESRDVEGSFAAGAGDSLTIPALQRAPSRACVRCGAPADAYCARCGVTPYCSSGCQRRDWPDRHRAVCHNLARLADKDNAVDHNENIAEDPIPPAAPLRQPKTHRRDEEINNDGQKSRNSNNNKQGGRNFNGPRQNRNERKPPRQDTGPEVDEDWGNKNKTSDKPPAPANPPAPTSAVPPPKPKTVEEVTPTHPKKASPKSDEKSEAPSTRVANGLTAVGKDAVAAKPLVPKNYLIEMLSIGDTALLSVESVGEECRATGGVVCLSMHERFETDYQTLCEQYTVDCDKLTGKAIATPGDSFSYLNSSDGGWYRARWLSNTIAALLDSAKVVTVTAEDNVKPLSKDYETPPEFCCLLTGANVKVGDNLKCTLVSETNSGYKVTLVHVETGASAGEGEVGRWLPLVEYPQPAKLTAAIQPQIPEVSRPDVKNNTRVVLVEATSASRVLVRPSDPSSQRRYDQVLQDAVLAGRAATPLKTPPQKGQVVLGLFSDGLHYRALCKRTNVAQNKYLLEYIEFGNVEITQLEKLYLCPGDLELSSRPTEASVVELQCQCPDTLTQPAIQYLDTLKEDATELILTIPSGASTAASGSAVCLAVAKNNESVNRTIEKMCTPEWKKIEERGGDVVESECLMYQDLEYLELPVNGCEIDVLDISALAGGSVSGCERGLPHYDRVLTTLTKQMEDYCNSEIGKEPYLPKFEELCVARFPPYPQWFRAVLLEQTPGAATARVCYVDYGNVEEVPVAMLRKMLPGLVRGQPALASHLEIKDFPKDVTAEMLARAVAHMNINEEGRGTLKVTRCEKQEGGLYLVHAPELINAMTGK